LPETFISMPPSAAAFRLFGAIAEGSKTPYIPPIRKE